MELSGGGAATVTMSAAPAEPIERKAAPYVFHGQTTSLCETCLEPVAAKVILEDDCVWYLKRCLRHGVQKTLISDDIEYWRQQKLWLKPGDRPLTAQTRTEAGCPFDCGLCPDHEQHSCLAIVEINQACNLACPVCFADATDIHGSHVPLAQVERMLDALVASEGEPDLVQLSGGEPTIHPEFFAILDAAKLRPIRHVMINTNGLRIAQDPEFVARLAAYAPRLEVYLQFDSLDDDALLDLRGARLSRIRRQALEALEAAGLSTTLVAVVKRGVNDGEIAAIVREALRWPCVRGVTFQPVQDAGRNEGFDAGSNRVLLTQIRREVAKAGVFSLNDMIPLPCNPDQICIGYGLRQGDHVTPYVAAPARADPQRTQHDQLRSLSRAASEDVRPAVPGDGAGEHRGQAGEPAVLPAGGDGAGGAFVCQQLSGRDPAVSRPLQLRPRHGEAQLRPFRHGRRRDHPVRHLQHVLSRGGGRSRRAPALPVARHGGAPMKSLFGGLFLGAGILIAGLSGLCSLLILVMSVADGQVLDMLPIVLIVGGIPVAIGLGLFFIGRAMLRSARKPTSSHPEQEFE